MLSDCEDEVTREPFEVVQPNYVSEDDTGSENEKLLPTIEIKNDKHHSHRKRQINSLPTTRRQSKRKIDVESSERDNDAELSNCNSDSNSNVSSPSSQSSFERDEEFAKSFGIVLKGFKSNKYKAERSGSERASNQKQDVKDQHILPASITSDCTYHRGNFYQKGDIVALKDIDDNQIYFAQLTGFLQDQFCEKSASVYWLVPTKPTTRDIFEPSAYKIGYIDNRLRKLDCMTFIRHCPSDYYLNKDKTDSPNVATSFDKKSTNNSYIWTSLDPCKVSNIN